LFGHRWTNNDQRSTIFAIMPRKKRITKKDLLKVEQGAVREEQKAQGALDGRFREKVVPNKKRRTKPKHKGDEIPE
jgi:hypothetical protein